MVHANVKAGVTQKLNAEVSLELRTFENAGKVEQGFFEAGLEYKLIDYLSVAGSYRLTDELEDDSKYYLQHHFILDLKGNLKLEILHFREDSDSRQGSEHTL